MFTWDRRKLFFPQEIFFWRIGIFVSSNLKSTCYSLPKEIQLEVKNIQNIPT